MTMRLPDPWAHDQPESPESALKRRRVVIALHGGTSPVAAIDVGRRIASAMGAALHGIFVAPTPILASEVPRLLHIDADALEGMVLEVEVGEPAARLAAFTQTHPVCFLVLPVGEEGGDPCGLGQLAARTLIDANVGVIIVRPRVRMERLDRILVPLDGTPSTAASIGPACDLARRAGAALDIVLVGQAFPPVSDEPGMMSTPQYVDQPQHEWAAFSEEFLNRFLFAIAHVPRDVHARFFLRTGDPAAEILHLAAELESHLIALVWHGDLEDHGAVFSHVMSRADVPLLVLRR